MENLQVTRDTRAPRKGRLIQCPECDQETRVFHFSWVAISCSHCREMVNKYEWSVVQIPNWKGRDIMEKKLSKEEKIEFILKWYEDGWYGGTVEDIVDEVRQYLVSGVRGMKDWSDEEIDDEYETANE